MKNKNVFIILLSVLVIALLTIVVLLLGYKSNKSCDCKTNKNKYVCTKLLDTEDEDGNKVGTILSKDVLEYNEVGQITAIHSGHIFEFKSEEELQQAMEDIQAINEEKVEKEDELKLFIYTDKDLGEDILKEQWIKEVVSDRVEFGYTCKKN